MDREDSKQAAAMETISAACAMEWSMELEKALRSKRPGQAVKAIQQIGERLQQWNSEPKPTMAVYNMYGLVPGEDRLFANTILLRLAEAFRLGDKGIRLSIVRVFLSEFKNRGEGKKGKRYVGILSRPTVQNHMELLKRVKTVFDTGDVESRALALVLFGCWVDFAKDSIHVRYLIFSCLVSSEILEVKASLFAAGCFCELAADFASVALDMLLNIIISPDSLLTIRLAGARVFSKMGCSYSIANRAHQIGVKLLLDSSNEDFSVAMMVSLSKLAAKSILDLSEQQVNLLLLFLNQERTLRLQATALRCLHFIFMRGVCQPPVRTHLIKMLLRVVDETELPSAMQCVALKVLQKLLAYQLLDLDCDNMLEFTHVLVIVEKAAQSSALSKSLIAIRVLIDILVKLRGRTYIGSDEYCFSSLRVRIISVFMDRIISLMKPGLDVCENNSKVFQEFQSLLRHLLFLVREYPDLGVLMLEKIRSFIEYLVDMHDSILAGASTDEFMDFRGQKCMDISLNVVNNVHKFSVTCIQNLNEVGSIANEIVDKIKLLVECVHRCTIFDSYIHLIYSILHSRIILGCVLNKHEQPSSIDRDFSNSLCNQLVKYEIFSLELAEKILTEGDNWHAYKAGTFAAYQGAWIMAAFIFEQLIGKVQSDSFSCWLKTLAQVAQSEAKIWLFHLGNLGSCLVDWLQTREFCIKFFEDNFDEIGQGAFENFNGSNYSKVLTEAYYGLRSSEETLKSIPILGKSYCFQRWFLALRVKVLRTMVDALKVLSTIRQGNISNNEQVEKSVTVECLDSLRQITQLSFQLKSLAEEFDLIAMSFIGMDVRSSKFISALALGCSLLAFTTAFGPFISNFSDNENLTSTALESLGSYRKEIFIENLVERLWLVDQETCSDLCLLLMVSGQSKYCCHLQSRSQILNSDGGVRDILDNCRHAVSTVVALQNEAKGVHDAEILSRIADDGFQLVLKTITRWMHIPFGIPKYFFRMRPCIGSELIAFSADARNPNELIVFPGCHLAINLCLQLRNLPQDLPFWITKLYCVVCSSVSFQEPKSSREKREQVPLDYQVPDISMIAMNKRLLHHVTELEKESNCSKHGKPFGSDSDDGIVYSFVCFQLNDKGQGFSNCLLNVSNFPLGSYRVKWHSCCIDNRGCYWSLISQNAGPILTIQG